MELLSTGQMIERLNIGDQAEYKHQERTTDHHLIVQKTASGSIVVVYNGIHENRVGKLLTLSAKVMTYQWRVIPQFFSFEEAMKAHLEGKTVAYHHSDELVYEFNCDGATDQFKQLYHDSIYLQELIKGNWSIKN